MFEVVLPKPIEFAPCQTAAVGVTGTIDNMYAVHSIRVCSCTMRERYQTNMRSRN